MNKKSKILITTFFLLIVASALAIYYRHIVLKNFEVIESTTEESISEESE